VQSARSAASASTRSAISASAILPVLAVLAQLLPSWAGAQQPDSVRSTRAGVYTSTQAVRGGEIYALNCVSCHTPVSHTGATFATKWEGHRLSELYEFVRGSMPKSDPGSLTRKEYLLVTVYLLKLNGMPAGAVELPSDTVALSRIRIELKPSADPDRER
jgi:mono/diheme cytochrome c family protein